ncbi:MAG: site-specific integrase [Phycisphaerae bacterium]|nr:site-specific integrase [Phycisphaerae bacterium]
MVARFVKWGLLPKEKAAAGNLLSEHLEQWRQAVSVKNTSKHADLLYARAKRVFGGCEFRTWTQIEAGKVQKYLNELRKDSETKRGISAQTFNFYVQAVCQFCKWMIQTGKANGNPLAYLPKLNTKTDRRHDRRALDVSEIERLYGATINAEERFGMTGRQRYLCYRVAIESGLRASEMRSLRVMDFDLEGLTVTVQAAYSKNRQKAVIPLRKDTAEELRDYLRDKLPTAKAFTMPTANDLVKMLRADLKSAGIEYRDESGRVVDFHGLRHTTASLLAQSGVHPKVAQQIMRHSTVELTLGRYSHVYRGQEAAAVEALPSIQPVFSETVRTGTDGEKSITFSITKQGLFSQSNKDATGQLDGSTLNAKNAVIEEKKRGF